MPLRRSLLALPALLLARAAAAAPSITKDVRLIVPFAPGGTVDFVGRVLAEALGARMPAGRNVVVENRSGAGTFIAMQAVAQVSDGHVLSLSANTNLATAPVLPGFVLPLDIDALLAPITSLIRVPMVLVTRSDAPYSTLPQLIAHAKANPGKLNIGNSGQGGQTHLLAARMLHEAGISMEHVQYRGGTPALLDILAGNCDLYFSLLPESIAFIRDGRMKPIAFCSPERNLALPSVPLMLETLPGFTGDAGYGMVMAAATPSEWQAFWNAEINAVLAKPEVRERMLARDLVLANGSAAAYRAELMADRATWGAVIRAAGIRAG